MKLPKGAGIWGLVLSQAPLLFEAAAKIAEHLRARRAPDRDGAEVPPEEMTLPELGAEVARLRTRLQGLDDAQLEQVKLIGQVVEQHRALARAMGVLTVRFRVVAVAALVFLLLDAWLIWRLLKG